MVDPFSSPAIPFHFWSAVFFWLGCMVGSFLNVCIHRMPLGLSVVKPRSHCPHCHYSIPWYLNIPLVTWLMLRGACAHCRAPISIRYFLVELLTGLAFLACWLSFGATSPALAAALCVLLAGFIVATFIDFEHFIIPDEITLGGIVAGFLLSGLVPALHGAQSPAEALFDSLLGIAIGWGLIYGILRLGKWLFGRQRLQFEKGTALVFTEEFLALPDEHVPYEEIFYRDSDQIEIDAHAIELPDRCYANARVTLSKRRLRIADDAFDPATIPYMRVMADNLVLPREAMGFGDVKFMGAIGAFLGWKATLFSLMASSLIGSVVGIALIALRRREWSSRIPYGPYIALAATLWVFGFDRLVANWFSQ